MGDGEQDEREQGQRKQYHGYSHAELAALLEWHRDAIIRRRIQENLNKMTDGTSNDGHTTNRNFGYARKKEDCFIAGVVYGGREVGQVRVLREYRDNVLMQEVVGRKFIDWYYDGRGERMAEFIKNRASFLIPIIRKGLDFFVEDYLLRKGLES